MASPMELDESPSGSDARMSALIGAVTLLEENCKRELNLELESVRDGKAASDLRKRRLLESFLSRGAGAGSSSSIGRRQSHGLVAEVSRRRQVRYSPMHLSRSNSRTSNGDRDDAERTLPPELRELAGRALVQTILTDSLLSRQMERNIVRAAERFQTDPHYRHVHHAGRRNEPQRQGTAHVPQQQRVPPQHTQSQAPHAGHDALRHPRQGGDDSTVRMTVSVTEQVEGEVRILASWRRVSAALTGGFRQSLEAHLARRLQRVRLALRGGQGAAAWATMMDRYYSSSDAASVPANVGVGVGIDPFVHGLAEHRDSESVRPIDVAAAGDAGGFYAAGYAAGAENEYGFAASLRRWESRAGVLSRDTSAGAHLRNVTGIRRASHSGGSHVDVSSADNEHVIMSLRNSVERLQEQVAELRRVMAVSVDLQLDTHMFVRQEVAAAMSRAKLTTTESTAIGGGASPSAFHRQRGGSALPLSSTCVVCLEQPSDTLLYGCGHMCACTPCGRMLKADKKSCPVCRAPIRDAVRVFSS